MTDGDNEWRFGRVRLLKVEIWVRGGDEKTDDGHTADVEENDTDVDALDRTRDVATRVLGLSGGDGDDLGSEVGVGSLRHDGPPREEATLASANVVELREGTRVLPVTETDTVVVRASTEVEDDTKDDQSDDSDDFNGSKHELCFSISSCRG